MRKFEIRKVLFALCVMITFLTMAITIRTHVYKIQTFSIEYGLPANQILNYLKKWIPWSPSGVYVIFIYNGLPSESEIEDINKLSSKNGKEVKFFSIFHRRFKRARLLNIPYKFVPFKRTHCRYQDDLLDKNYFLIFNNERLIFAGKYLDVREIHFYLLKQKFQNKPLSDYFVNGVEYRKKIIDKLRDGSRRVYKLNDDGTEKIGDIINKYSEIYFINADCSECELKAVLSDLTLKGTVEDIRQCLIFSIYANKSILRRLFVERKINIQAFVDSDDIFGVMDLIIDGHQKSIRLTKEEILKEI